VDATANMGCRVDTGNFRAAPATDMEGRKWHPNEVTLRTTDAAVTLSPKVTKRAQPRSTTQPAASTATTPSWSKYHANDAPILLSVLAALDGRSSHMDRLIAVQPLLAEHARKQKIVRWRD